MYKVSAKEESSISPPKLNNVLSETRLNSHAGLQLLNIQSSSTLTMEAVMAEATRLHAPNPRKANGMAISVPANAAAIFRMANALKFICFVSWVTCTMANDWIISTTLCTLSSGFTNGIS